MSGRHSRYRATVQAYTYDTGYNSYAVVVSEEGGGAGESWLVSRRYSEFLALFRALQTMGGGGTASTLATVTFPNKGAPNKSDAQLEKRRQQLDLVLQAMLRCQPLRPQLATLLHEFLDVERQAKLIVAHRRNTAENDQMVAGVSMSGSIAAMLGFGFGGGARMSEADRSLRKFWSMLVALVAALVAAVPQHAVAVCACFASGVLTALVGVRHEPMRRVALVAAAAPAGGSQQAQAAHRGDGANSSSSGGGGGGVDGAIKGVSKAAYLRAAEGALAEAAKALTPLESGFRQHSVNQGVTVYLKDEGPLTYALGQAVLPVAPWVALATMTDRANKPTIDPSWKKDTPLEELPPAALDRTGGRSGSDAATSGRVGVSCVVTRTEMKPVLMTGARDLVTVLALCYDRDAGAVFRVAASVEHAAAPVDDNYVRAKCFCVGFAMQRATAAQAATAGLAPGSAAAKNATLMTHITMMDPNGSIPKWIVAKTAPQRALAPLRLLGLPAIKAAAATTAAGGEPMPPPDWWTRAPTALGVTNLVEGGGGNGGEVEADADESKSGADAAATTAYVAAARSAWNTIRAAADCEPTEAGWKLHSTPGGVSIFLQFDGAIAMTMARTVLPCAPRAVAGVISSLALKPQHDLNWRSTRRVEQLAPSLFDTEGAAYRTAVFAVDHSLFNKVLVVAPRDVVAATAITMTPVNADDPGDAEPAEIVFAVQSVEHPDAAPTSEFVRATVSVGGFVLRAVPGNAPDEVFTSVTNLTVMDAGGSVPSWVTNRVAPQRGLALKRISDMKEIKDSAQWVKPAWEN